MRVIHEHMVVEAMGTYEAGKGKKHRNKESQGQNFGKLYMSRGGKSQNT